MRPDAVVFPGQGAQRRGMGADFHQGWQVARRTFEEASDAVGEDLARICFERDERLHLTEFTQPCVLTVEIAAYRVAVEEFGFAPGLFGGHSLGEYAALVAAGVMPFADAVALVRARGALMQQAVPKGGGTMAALLFDDIATSPAFGIATAAGAEIVNHNSPAQVVAGGTVESIEAARTALAQALPDLTFVPLRVSAPFHSSLMRPVEREFAVRLASVAPRLRPRAAAAVTSNRTGGFHEPAALEDNLVRQIAAPVRWLDNMRALADRAGRIYEIGPGTTLTKFFAALDQQVTSIGKAEEARERLRGYTAPRPQVQEKPPARQAAVGQVVAPRAGVGRAAAGRTAEAVQVAPVSAPFAGTSAGGAAATMAADAGAERLGAADFRRDHGVRLAYVAGGMRLGISSPELVIRLGRAGLLGYLGTAGLPPQDVEDAIRRVRHQLPADAPWGVNLVGDAHGPELGAMVELLLRTDVRRVEAAGFTSPVPELVRYRLTGLRAGTDGRPLPARRLLAKVGRADVARLFLQPPPEETVRRLRARGLISEEEARLAPYLPMADDVCAETDPAGQGSAFSLLPAVRRTREEVATLHPALARVRVGVAGGLGSAEAVAAAFTMGADFVLTGSVNQCTPQAGTSDLVKDMLADADVQDFGTAPAAELLEQGGRASVLRKGVLFPARAERLSELYLRHDSLDDLSPADREHAEKQCFGRTFADVWTEVRAQYAGEDRARLARIERNPQTRLALTVRWYLLDTLRRARVGDPAERLSFQVRSGPAMGAFNHEVRGTGLADWRRRHVDDVAWFLMRGAARVVREHGLLVHPVPEPVGAPAGV